jgi:nucleotide-binding universal stress UspA family protein
MTNKPVVVAIDGSVAAEAAIKWAVTEALSLGTSLRLVHAFAWPLAAVPSSRREIEPGLAEAADLVITRSLQLAQELAPARTAPPPVMRHWPWGRTMPTGTTPYCGSSTTAGRPRNSSANRPRHN